MSKSISEIIFVQLFIDIWQFFSGHTEHGAKISIESKMYYDASLRLYLLARQQSLFNLSFYPRNRSRAHTFCLFFDRPVFWKRQYFALVNLFYFWQKTFSVTGCFWYKKSVVRIYPWDYSYLLVWGGEKRLAISVTRWLDIFTLIWPFTIIKICPIEWKFCPSRFKI